MVLTSQAGAAFAPAENPPWKDNPGSDLGKLLKGYDAPERTQFDSELSGFFQLSGLGYESDLIDEFAVGDDILFSNQDGLSGGWSSVFNIDDAVLRVNWDTNLEYSVQPTSSLNKAYQLNADWTYSPTGTTFQNGDYILGLGDGYGDSDYDDLVVGLKAAAAPVPEPETVVLLGLGLLGIAILGRQKYLQQCA